MTIKDFVKYIRYNNNDYYVFPENAYDEMYKFSGTNRKQIDNLLITAGLFPESLLGTLYIFGTNAGKAFAFFHNKNISMVGLNQISETIAFELSKYGISHITIIDPIEYETKLFLEKGSLYKSTEISIVKKEVRPYNADTLLGDSSFILCISDDMQAKFEAWQYAKRNKVKRWGLFTSEGNSVIVPPTHNKDITGIFKKFTKGYETFTPGAVKLAADLAIDNTIKSLLYDSLPEEGIITFYHTDKHPTIYKL